MSAFALHRLLVASAFAATQLACNGEPITRELDEPVRVNFGTEEAQFIPGTLPGSAPISYEEQAGGKQPIEPALSNVTHPGSNQVYPGEPGKQFSGLATLEAAAVGVQLLGAGTGYWVAPVGHRSADDNAHFEFGVSVDFAYDAPPGPQHLYFVGIDAKGLAGTQKDETLCVASPVPDNGNACNPKTKPPALVVSLDWDRPVDLDLSVALPSGRTVDPEHPSTAKPGDDPNAPGTGAIDIDAGRNCSDGPRRENLVFQEQPPKGDYLVYVNLFSDCGQPSVRFNVTIHQPAIGDTPGTYEFVETSRTSGSALAAEANAGTAIGLYLTHFIVD